MIDKGYSIITYNDWLKYNIITAMIEGVWYVPIIVWTLCYG